MAGKQQCKMADGDERASDDAGDDEKGARTDDAETGKGSGRDRELATAIKRRDAALQEAREAKRERDEHKERIKELESFKTKYEELEGDKGKAAGIIARKDEANAKAQSRIKELETELGGLHRSYRHRDFVDKLAAETKVSGNVLRGLLHVLKTENPNFEDAPEDPSDKAHLKTTVRLLQELEPTVFTPPEKEKPRARPGPSRSDHLRNLPPGERPASDRIAEIEERARNKHPRPGQAGRQ